MTKIWLNAFWKARPDDSAGMRPLSTGGRISLFGPISGLAAITLAIGLYPRPFYELAERAAAGLMEPKEYVETVLGAGASPDTERRATVRGGRTD